MDSFEGHTFSTMIDGVRREWKVTSLWMKAMDIPMIPMLPEDIPEWKNLMELEVERCWGVRDETGKPVSGFPFSKLVQDVKRIMEADLNCPILLGPDGRVMDGIHRLVKAHALGELVLVQQFEEWP